MQVILQKMVMESLQEGARLGGNHVRLMLNASLGGAAAMAKKNAVPNFMHFDMHLAYLRRKKIKKNCGKNRFLDFQTEYIEARNKKYVILLPRIHHGRGRES